MSGLGWRTGRAFVVVCAAAWFVPTLSSPSCSILANDVALPELTNDTRVHLQRVEALLATGQTVEALDSVRRVMTAAKSAIIEVDSPHAAAGFRCYLPVRVALQMKLAEWHETAPEMLRIYRQQVDGVAQRWFDEALESGDEAGLRRIVDQYFCSRVGDNALFWLGEFAFQRGDYATARSAWERIHPSFRWASDGTRFDRYTGLPSWLLLRQVDLQRNWPQIVEAVTGRVTKGRWLAYPDTDLDIDSVRARLVLCSIMLDQRQRAKIELEIFRRLSPGAVGRLGGKRGNYVERLQQLLNESQSWPASKLSSDWPTFGGAPNRSRHVARAVDVAGQPIWRLPLPIQSWIDPVDGANRLRIGEDPNRLLSFHPIVVNDLVLFGTDDQSVDVQAVNLHTGAIVFQTNSEPTPAATYDDRLARTVPRFTMSSSGSRLFARVIGRGADTSAGNAPTRSRLVAIDLRAEGRLRFDVQLEAPAWQGDWSFEGSPVCDESYLYVAVRRLDAVRAESHLACFDARDGKLCWRQFICAAQSLGGDHREIPNNLLTLDEGVLFYNTNAGAVAAVAAQDGAIRWLTRYPRAANDSDVPPDLDMSYRFRDLNPCLVQDGLVYVAPADCSRLFALDAATGHLIWTTPEEIGGDIVHLLGVADGHLIGSGEGLYWFDAYNGQLAAQVSGDFHPSEGHARQEPRGCGRGLLANKNVYWPTRESIFVFDQRIIKTESGWNPVLLRDIDLVSRRVAGGNLVMVDGILLIASGDHLYAFNESGLPTHAAD
jgi:outer membrane protein assembly factor BamB